MQDLINHLNSNGFKLVNKNARNRASWLLRLNKSQLQIEALYQGVTLTAGTKIEQVSQMLLASNWLELT